MCTTKLLFLNVLLAGILPSAFAGPLHDAAIRGDVTEMRRLLEKESDVNSRDEDGWTALHFAAQGGRVEAVRLLLCNGAEIDAQSSKTGNTALMYAARSGNSGSEEVVKLLLERGADINLREWQMGGHTALSLAQWRGFANIAHLIQAAPRERAQRAKASEAARIQAVREQTEERISQLTNAPLVRLLGKQELDRGEYVEALTDAIITAKNNQLSDLLATAGSKQRIDLLTSVEKQIARATAGIDEANAEAGAAVSKGHDPAPFRKRAGQIKAYINVLNEIKAILEQS